MFTLPYHSIPIHQPEYRKQTNVYHPRPKISSVKNCHDQATRTVKVQLLNFPQPTRLPLEHIRKVNLRKETADVDALFGLPVAVSFGTQMSIAVGLSLSKIVRIGSYPNSYSCKAFATSKLRLELID